MLSDETKAQRVQVSRELLELAETEVEAFWDKIVTVMKHGSTIVTLKTRDSPWNTTVRTHQSRVTLCHCNLMVKLCFCLFLFNYGKFIFN